MGSPAAAAATSCSCATWRACRTAARLWLTSSSADRSFLACRCSSSARSAARASRAAEAGSACGAGGGGKGLRAEAGGGGGLGTGAGDGERGLTATGCSSTAARCSLLLLGCKQGGVGSVARRSVGRAMGRAGRGWATRAHAAAACICVLGTLQRKCSHSPPLGRHLGKGAGDDQCGTANAACSQGSQQSGAAAARLAAVSERRGRLRQQILKAGPVECNAGRSDRALAPAWLAWA